MTTEESKKIEMKYLKDSGYLCGWTSRIIQWTINGEPSGKIRIGLAVDHFTDEPHAILNYKTQPCGEDWIDIEYKVEMSSTPCRYGGKRWWFHCPIARCGRRCSILYQDRSYFVCRKCARLSYESQRYSGKYSMLHNMFQAEEYADTIKRWYYRGKPTRKHRRYLKMMRGMTEEQMCNHMLEVLKC